MEQNKTNSIHEIERYEDYLDDMGIYAEEARIKQITLKEFLLKYVGLNEHIAENLFKTWKPSKNKPKLVPQETENEKQTEHSKESSPKKLKSTLNWLLSNDPRIKFQTTQINHGKIIPWSLREIWIGFLILSLFICSALLEALGFSLSNVTIFIIFLFNTTIMLPALIAYPLYVGKKRDLWPLFERSSWKQLCNELLSSIGNWLVIILVMGPILYFFALFIPSLNDPDPFLRELINTQMMEPTALFRTIQATFLFLIIVVGPIAEELFFRYFLYNALKTYLPILLAIFLQAILFGVIHGFPLMIYAFFIGIALAVVYEKRKNIIRPIFVHSIFNTGAVIIVLLSNK
jgi:membrane protease YdiL (CAAX protease family)